MLVADDEPTVRMLVVEVLEDLGYTAIEAGDGPAGLQILRSDARIDLLVTDLGLPGGMNGRQVADAAKLGRTTCPPHLDSPRIGGGAPHPVRAHSTQVFAIPRPVFLANLGMSEQGEQPGPGARVFPISAGRMTPPSAFPT